MLLTAACGSPADVVVTQTVTPGVTPAAGGRVTVTPPGSGSPAAGSTGAVPVWVVVTPKLGSTRRRAGNDGELTVFNATITTLTVTDSGCNTVQGEVNPDPTGWGLTERLRYAQTYTVSGSVTDTAGVVTLIDGQLATVNPESTLPASFVIDEGGTFGVGHPS